MNEAPRNLWNEKLPNQLLLAITLLSNSSDLEKFLRDVMTEKEITEISARLEAARLLKEGASYETIAKSTGLSTRTIARISQWLKQGTGGYATALETLTAHHSHIPPARAE